MRRIYIEKWCETVNTAPLKYVFSSPVPAGHILHVHNCYAHAPERDQNEIIWLGVRDSGRDSLVRARAAGIAAEGMSARRDFLVGEGDQIFAYFPSAETTDKIELHVIGCLIPLDEFREKGE